MRLVSIHSFKHFRLKCIHRNFFSKTANSFRWPFKIKINGVFRSLTNSSVNFWKPPFRLRNFAQPLLQLERDLATAAPPLHYSFSRSKYFHLLIAPVKGFIYNKIDRKIDVIAILFLLVQNRRQIYDCTLIGSGANGLGIQKWLVLLNTLILSWTLLQPFLQLLGHHGIFIINFIFFFFKKNCWEKFV